MNAAERQAAWTGIRVRHYRLANAYTQDGLAKAVAAAIGGDIDLHQSTISNWERGASQVSLRYRRALAKVLEVPMDILFETPPDGWRETRAAA